MDYISVKKLSEKYKIDFYQFISYLEFLNIPIEIKNNIKTISNENIALIDKFISTYTTNQIKYIKSHNIKNFYEGTLLLDLLKKYNLNEKQFKNKCANANFEFKYVYSNEECEKFDNFINSISNMNRAELRDLKYIKEGWIPLRNIFNEFGEKYDFCENTGDKILEYLGIKIYRPSHQFAFINNEQKNKFEDFLKKFSSAKERKLFFQEQTCMKKYGVSNPSCSDEARNKISEKVKESCTEERQKKIEESKLKKYGKRSITDSEKSMKSRIENNGSLVVNHKYEYDNLQFHSSWELYYYIYEKEILGNNISRGNIFEYEFDGKIHRYECDFIVNDKNVEIKGNQYLDENEELYFPYTKQTKIDSIEKQKQWNAKQKCMEENNVQIISKKEINSIIKIVDEKYTKDYITLFKIDLEFPYPTIKNKSDYDIIRYFHKSIYHARRNGELSPFEAWQNKNLVKKSALNRLKYIGTCKPFDVVQGFNIAKIAPKVSVFNPKLAEELIKKYLNDYDIIVDSFSGFSGRMIGAWRCGKKYIGYDINKTHVEESNTIINYFDMKNCSVSQTDLLNAEETSYDKNYAFFTCSPYEDKEIWNENEIIKSCDEWIDLCLKKHKCKKYLFVVDKTEKYKNNIVEIIENKSHFGSNNEYVILIEK